MCRNGDGKRSCLTFQNKDFSAVCFFARKRQWQLHASFCIIKRCFYKTCLCTGCRNASEQEHFLADVSPLRKNSVPGCHRHYAPDSDCHVVLSDAGFNERTTTATTTTWLRCLYCKPAHRRTDRDCRRMRHRKETGRKQ